MPENTISKETTLFCINNEAIQSYLSSECIAVEPTAIVFTLMSATNENFQKITQMQLIGL